MINAFWIIIVSVFIVAIAVTLSRRGKLHTQTGLIMAVIGFFAIALAVVWAQRSILFVYPTESESIAANLATQQNFVNANQFLKDSWSADDYNKTGQFTFFAPTDEAFGKLPESTRAILDDKNNYEQNVSIEDNHVILGNYPTSSFSDGMKLTTVKGEIITINRKDNKWFINNSIEIVKPDIKSNNGVIHGINTVMLPKDL